MEYDGDAISEAEWFAAECEEREDGEPKACYGYGTYKIAPAICAGNDGCTKGICNSKFKCFKPA